MTCEVEIDAPIEAVYETLTTAKGLGRWWGHRIASDVALGSVVELRLAPGRVLHVRVDDLIAPSLVTWTCVGGVAEWRASILRFELAALRETTLLRFAHRGWRWRQTHGALSLARFSWPRQVVRLGHVVRVPNDALEQLAERTDGLGGNLV